MAKDDAWDAKDGKGQAALVDADIPDDLKEQSPPESVAMLEKRFDELLGEIKALQDSRGRDFQNADARRDRLPALPNTTLFERYRALRQEKLDSVSKIEMPVRQNTVSTKILEEIEESWNVDETIHGESLLYTLRDFYYNKSMQLLEENDLLMSRWNRFCKSYSDISKLVPQFNQYQSHLLSEFKDSTSRYERLTDTIERRIQKLQEEEAAREEERKEAERSGLPFGRRVIEKQGRTKMMAVAKEALKIKKNIEKEKSDQAEKEAKELMKKEVLLTDENDIPSDMQDPGFEISDLLVYMRYLIADFKGGREMNIFNRRAAVMSHMDRVQMVKDYRLVSKIQPGKDLLETIEDFDGINLFFDKTPMKTPKVEDFLTEFEILCAQYSIQTPIHQEDARPFCYEVDVAFQKRFARQIIEENYPPYDTFSESEPNSSGKGAFGGNSGPGFNSTSSPADRNGSFSAQGTATSFFDTKSSGLGGDSASNSQYRDVPKLKTADWVIDMAVLPNLEDWQEAQCDQIRSRKDIDFELLCEFDLVCTNDNESVTLRLKDTARRLWEAASKKANCRPMVAKQTTMPKPSGLSIQEADKDDVLRIPHTFDLGMMLPDGRERLSSFHVLDGKKQQFGQILRANEEAKMIEQELLNVDPNRTVSNLNIIDPTIATIFAEHEILSFVQLRHVRIRDLRETLRRQLNFMRSIEKRINLDVRKTRDRFKFDVTDPEKPSPTSINSIADVISLVRQQQAFEPVETIISKGEASATGNSSASGSKAGNGPFLDVTEDIRLIKNGRVTIQDSLGVSIIYDVAIQDLKNLEKQLIKLATVYINKGPNGREPMSSSYMDDLRFKLADRRTDLKDCTYLNATADRSQILLELYSAEVKFQYAKIDAINAYMEVFENTRDLKNIEHLSQVITNLIHLRPYFDLESEYFSRDYTMQTKAVELQTRLIVAMVQRFAENHREWLQRFDQKLSQKKAGGDADNSVFTLESGGLPFIRRSNEPQIIMHHACISVALSEIIPWLSVISRIEKVARQASSELGRMLQSVITRDNSNLHLSYSSLQCVVWKGLMSCWRELEDYDFKPPLKGRRMVGGLDSDLWLENPLLPDLVLSEKYVPYELSDDGNSRSLGNSVAQHNMFTDPPFKPKGRDVLCRLLKTLLLRNRLLYSWFETEYWKSTFEDQFPQMGVNKELYCGRLGALRYDIPEMADNTVVEDEDMEDFDSSDLNQDAPAVDVSEPHSGQGVQPWRVGPLAIAELDESQCMFEFNNFQAIVALVRPLQLKRQARALKIQLLEKNWLMACVEIHSLLLFDMHQNILFEKDDDKNKVIEQNKSKGKHKSGNNTAKEVNATQYDVEYKLLVTSMIPKKKQMRKAMLMEYAKEHRIISKKEISDREKENDIVILKNKLIDWYFSNISEVVIEECERAEHAKLMLEIKLYTSARSFGKILYRNSRISKNVEYFTNEKPKVDAIKHLDSEKMVEVQEMVFTDLNGTDKLTSLWYIPHHTESLMGFIGNERTSKVSIDLSAKMFKNSLVYQRSTNIHLMLFEILKMVCMFAHLLCDNNRFVKSVRDLREIDYVVTVMGQIKKELQYQGTTAEFSRVESFLTAKWRIWFLRLRLAITSVAYTLHVKMMPAAFRFLQFQAQIMAQDRSRAKSEEKGMKLSWNLAKTHPRSLVQKLTKVVSMYAFAGLDTEAKRCADIKILELDDCMEQYLQATLLNFGENTDEVNKTQTEYLTTCLRLFGLRNEYIRLCLQGNLIKTDEQVKEFMRMYKMRIIVGAVRLYHKLGAKGNASTAFLLRDEIVTSTIDMEFSRMSQTAFDRCQITVLLGELSRLYTSSLYKQAKQYYERIADERTGRLFKLYDTTDIKSQDGDRRFAFNITEDEYSTKSNILHTFVEDLWRAAQESKTEKNASIAAAAMQKGKSKAYAAHHQAHQPTADDNRTFTCSKDALSKAILNLGLNLTKWQQSNMATQENFTGSSVARLNTVIRNNERLINQLTKEKTEMIESYSRDVRLASAHAVADIYSEMAALAVEVNDLRKSRRVDERKLRNKIIDEYDDMVGELVMENQVIRNRFNEYRTNTVHEVLGIISETKKEELTIIAKSQEIPDVIRKSAERSIKHEEEISVIKEDIHELNMTLLKVRSMYSLKEQSLRSAFEKKLRKLTEDNRIAEEKLWDSYKEAEARERAIRRMITKLNKNLIASEAQNDALQRQLRDEQSRVRGSGPTKSDRSMSARFRSEGPANLESRAAELEVKLKRYEGIDIDKLLNELSEKTLLVEELLDKERSRSKEVEPNSRRSKVGRSPSPGRAIDKLIRKAQVEAERDRAKVVEDLMAKMSALSDENRALKQRIADLGVSINKKKGSSRGLYSSDSLKQRPGSSSLCASVDHVQNESIHSVQSHSRAASARRRQGSFGVANRVDVPNTALISPMNANPLQLEDLDKDSCHPTSYTASPLPPESEATQQDFRDTNTPDLFSTMVYPTTNTSDPIVSTTDQTSRSHTPLGFSHHPANNGFITPPSAWRHSPLPTTEADSPPKSASKQKQKVFNRPTLTSTSSRAGSASVASTRKATKLLVNSSASYRPLTARRSGAVGGMPNVLRTVSDMQFDARPRTAPGVDPRRLPR
ncbi:hypothetical protein HDV05_004888 [Chytridiales sp. JEL 0842]|nr:hypothetical protein HDV05_004888 [Chytridiales sp. JEL 0842]